MQLRRPSRHRSPIRPPETTADLTADKTPDRTGRSSARHRAASLPEDDPIAPAAVSVRSIAKTFGERAAVDRVSWTIETGTFTGLVGPNGAGKTTLLRIITGLQRPDAGEASIFGASVWPDPHAIRQTIGVLPDDLRLFERLSGRELLAYIGLLRGIEPDEVVRRSGQLLDAFGFGANADELVADFSTGMRKKIGLATAMIHAPKILFLDEPFESVDPVSVRVLQDVLRAYQRAGGTVVLSSHVMETVQRLCEHVAIMDQGRIVRVGRVDELVVGTRLEDLFLASVSRESFHDSDLEWFRATASDELGREGRHDDAPVGAAR